MIILDIETTGLNHQKHAIIDLAAIEFENPTNQFHMQCRIRKNTQLDPEALEYNGFKIEDIQNPTLPSTQQIITKFQTWAKKIPERTLAGQNPDFDYRFLQYNYQLYGLKWDFGHRKIDQHTLAYAKALNTNYPIPLTENKTTAFNSNQIMQFVGLPPEPRPHNSALRGALWEAEAFSRLIKGKNLLKQFSQHPIPKYLK
jgi:DNA polymerase III epsilon subunit-like protein